jgi:hypothetical protein
MESAMGNIGGIVKSKLLSIGVTNPKVSPIRGPHKKPHRIIGICMGSSLFPSSGICPVIKGNKIPNAKKSPVKTKLFA